MIKKIEEIDTLQEFNDKTFSILDLKLRAYIVKRDEEYKRTFKINEYSASSAGKCKRMLVIDKFFRDYRNTKYSTKKIMLMGSIIHDFFQKEVLSNGHSEVSTTINFGDFKIMSHADFIDEEFVWELKTISSLNYVKEVPLINHIAQLTLYLGFNNKQRGKIVYIDKRYLAFVEHNIAFDEELYKKVIENFREVHEYVKKGVLPQRLSDFPDNQECSRCWHKKLCKENNFMNEIVGWLKENVKETCVS